MTRMRDSRDAYRVLVGKTKRKKMKTKAELAGLYKLHLQENSKGALDWSDDVQNRDNWRLLVNKTMKYFDIIYSVKLI